MKKILSVVLSAALLLSVFGIGASAVVDHSLQFQLPVVTAIEAEWNGEIVLSRWLAPTFSSANVDVTVYFDDGTYEALADRWSSSVHDQWWQVSTALCHETSVVTVFYQDSRLQSEWFGDAECCCEVDWDGFYATLPQAAFDFPADYIETFLQEFTPFTALSLEDYASPPFYGTHVFTFTAPESCDYYFGFGHTGWGPITVLDAQHNIIASSWNQMLVALQAGETYYVVAYSLHEHEATFIVSERQQQPSGQLTWWQRVNNWAGQFSNSLLGRIILSPFVIIFWSGWALFQFISNGAYALLAWLLYGGWIWF
ncbi:MAG: hypothetical protein FWD06_00385 [Oscillospiraceae bacterium]|nr:hypothetical protein [Oscillospiraceae bacterium]